SQEKVKPGRCSTTRPGSTSSNSSPSVSTYSFSPMAMWEGWRVISGSPSSIAEGGERAAFAPVDRLVVEDDGDGRVVRAGHGCLAREQAAFGIGFVIDQGDDAGLRIERVAGKHRRGEADRREAVNLPPPSEG